MNATPRLLTDTRPQPASATECGALEVLLTATAFDALLPYLDEVNLPRFDEGPRWTVRPEASLTADDCFDLAIVLCPEAAHLIASVELVQRLNGRRITTVLLVPEALEPLLRITPTFLTIIGPDDISRGLHILAHAMLAPVQQDGIVCCDFADILRIIDDGMRAQIVSVVAPSSRGAVQALIERLAPFVNSSGYGVCAALDTRFVAKGGLRDFYAMLNALKLTARQDAFVLASAPLCTGHSMTASAIVVTAPSSRYFRNFI